LKKGRKTLLILGVCAVISLVIGGSIFIQQTAKKNGWQQITGIETLYIVNRTAHGFELVWSTKKDVEDTQWVEVGTKQGEYPIVASLDNNNGVYTASITGLEANTHYYFRIRVGDKTYTLPSLVSNEITTPKEVIEKPISPAYGKVLLPSTKPYANGLLIYEIDGFYPLAVFTKQTGEWLLPLTGLVEKKNNKIATVSDLTPVLIKLFSYPEGALRTSVGQTRPLKQAILAGSTLRLAQAPAQKGEVLGVGSQTTLPQQDNNISQILYPKENAVIPGSTPLIKGTAPAGKDVLVLIQGSKQYSYRTKADDKGNWLIQAPVALEFGRYAITVTIQNGVGATTIVKRNFSIIKSGEQVLGVATGTPTLTPTVIVPTYASPTTAPTLALTPTETPTIAMYPTTVPTYFVPTATPPVTGGGVSPYLFGALFCIVIGAGLVLAF
jgi:hypothetical protein